MNDSDDDLIRQFKSGDKSAANELIARYYGRVVRAAKKRLEGIRLRATSEEDIAVSVFESLWQRADQKGFGDDDLATPDDLWKLLSTMVRFKSRDHVRNERRQKRGGDQLRGESAFANIGNDGEPGRIQDFAIDEASIFKMAVFREQHSLLMKKLSDDDLREICTLRLEGYQVKEISSHFSRSERWVKRKLALIRSLWTEELDGTG